MLDLILVFFSACLVNNLLLDGMLGVAPALVGSKKIDVARGLGACTVFVLGLTTLLCYPLRQHLLIPLDLQHLTLISFIVVISLSVLLAIRLLQRFKADLSREFALFLPLVLINTAVLGAVMLSTENTHGITTAVVFGLGSGVGFALLLPMIAAIQERIKLADIPEAFKDSAITLITLGIMSMAFMGFIGVGSN